MKKGELIKEIYEIAEKSAINLGYEIVDIEYKKGSKHDLLTIFIYKEEGIDLDDCSDMSRDIEDKIENRDLIENPYYLEVSSPGLDRPIKTKDDFRRNLNKDVEVKLYAPLNGEKYLEGILYSYDDENVTIKREKDEIKLPVKSISLMRQRIIF